MSRLQLTSVSAVFRCFCKNSFSVLSILCSLFTMATLEDKLAGEKLQYYCSSSEDEGDDEKGSALKEMSREDASLSKNVTHWSGTSQNTGPKGVVQDWQLYTQLEAEKRDENEKQRVELIKKLSTTTATTSDDEERRKEEELNREFEELMSEDFLQQFQKQRMIDMLRACDQKKIFGEVLLLNLRSEFLEAVEKEDKNVIIIIHIFDGSLACDTLNKCLASLANDYKFVKFCKISSNVAGMSIEFKQKGLPALLVYKGNQLIGNFVRITDELSDDFFPSDLENFLIENDMITDKNLIKF